MASSSISPTTAAIRPQKGPQERFLSTPADIAIYGGGAGGGKTWALLLEPLRHWRNPDFGAVIFRRTYPQITAEGGMWDESAKLYGQLHAKPTEDDLTWTFASEARVKFAHLQRESDKYNWQGAQIPLIGFDELTHFSEGQFFYLLSRNRSTCGVRPYVRGTCNPDPDSWVAKFIAWWIDQETGYAIPERAGKLRYFVRNGDKMIWADSPAELAEHFPNIPPKSVTFIPAKLQDNPLLMAADPGYLANLLALPLVDQERLLGGNWKIRPSAGKVFNRSWFPIVDAVPAGGRAVRFWDYAATEKKLKGNDPDSTAGVKMRVVDGTYYIEDCISVQVGPAQLDRLVENTASQDGKSVLVRWEEEGGSSGKRVSFAQVRALAGYDAKGVRPTGDKLQRAKALAAQAQVGNVKLLRGAWNEDFLTVLHHIPDWPHDDEMDAASGAFNELTTTRRLTSL